jgi:hypothetical protein
MIAAIRGRLSFANIMSVVAVSIALGGTSYAASLARNSVGSAQIKSKAVKNSDLGDAAVTSTKVKNGSLLAADFASGQLPRGATGATGATGAPGAPGTPGATGLTGPAGLLSGTIVRRVDVPLPQGAGAGIPGAPTSGFATCGPGEKIVGGSVNISDVPNQAAQPMEVLASRPSVNDVGNGTVPTDGQAYSFWKGTARTTTNGVTNPAMRVFAICALP